MTSYGNCPNCGGRLLKQVTIGEGDNKQTLSAEGDVLICDDCHQASTPDDAVKAADLDATEPAPGDSPRGEDGPERHEDSIVPEGDDFTPSPTTDEEVPVEPDPDE